MAVASVQDLLEACRINHILDSAQLDAVAGVTPRPSDPNALARELVRREFLTVWQVNQIIKGRARDLLLGSYVLLEKLGEGGMGAVFKARNWKLGHIVALKVIRKERLDNEAMIRRFRREIQAAGQLWHPNIVRAFDADEVNGTHFFVMEYVEGRDLARVVKERGPLPVTEACEYIRQAALGLQHAFERGLVHRDIKPSNLLLTRQSRDREGAVSAPLPVGRGSDAGVVKLLDMGLARFERGDVEPSTALTQVGTIMGTPDYIAPEQARDSHTADIRADLYSLGCTLYFLLTGRVPFPRGNVTEKLLKHQMDTPTPVRQLRPDAPPHVEALIEKLMAKRPEERYQTPAELAAALESLHANRETIVAVPRSAEQTLLVTASPFADIDLPASATLAVDSSPRRPKTASRRSWPRIAAGIAGVLLAAAVVLALVMSGGKKTETTADTAQPKKSDEPPPKKPSQKEKDDLEAKEREKDEQQRREKAEQELPLLITKAADAKTTFADLAKDVAAFKGKYGGTPAAIKAAEMLMKLPSPLDQLDPKKLPQDCIDYWRAAGREPPVELVGVLGEHRGRFGSPIRGIAWGSTGKSLAIGGADGVIQLCDAATLKPGHRLKGGSPIATTDGRLLALRDGSIVQWKSLESEPIESVLVKDVQGAGGLASTRDGRLLATIHGSDTIRIWDLTGPKPREKGLLKWPPGNIAAGFDAEGKRLIGWSQDKTIRLWDIQGDAPKDIATITGHTDWVSGATFTANGKTMVSIGTHDYTLRLWDVSQREPKPGPVMSFGTAGCNMATTADGKTLAIDMWTGVIWIVDLTAEGPKCRHILGQGNTDGKPHLHTSLAFSPDGKTLAASDTNYPNNITLEFWDVATGKEVQQLKGHTGSLWSVAFSPDCKTVATAGSDHTAKLWDSVSGSELHTLIGHTANVRCVVFSPDGKLLASGNDDKQSTLKLWDAATGAELRTLTAHGDSIVSISFSPDGKMLATASHDKTAKLWNLGTGKVTRTLLGHINHVYSVLFSPDAKMLVTAGNDGTLRFWNAASGAALRTIPTGGSVTQSAAISPDGKMLASSGYFNDHDIKLWDTATGNLIRTLKGHTGDMRFRVFSPDGKTLASSAADGTVRLWDPETGAVKKVINVGNGQGAFTLAFAADGRHLATANANGTVYILRVADGPPRALSAEEAKKQQEDEAKRLGVPVQMENSIGMKLNLIPAGRFLMGSPADEHGRQANEGQRHEVTLTKPFYIGVYEVTQAEYEKVTGKNPSTFNKEKGGGPDNPVETVSLEDIAAFCKKLSDLPEGKNVGRVYRLPTEAEWEYACRAGTQTAYYFGQFADELPRHGWFMDNAPDKTRPVGKLSPNAWGLYDMHGNAWEWCADVGRTYTSPPITDPIGPQTGPNRALRGGGVSTAGPRWDASHLRSAFRLPNYGIVANNVGFRVVCDYRPPQITNSIGMKLARIPAGKFLMGSPENEPGRQANEGPQHEVTITKPFHIGVYEVTQAEYEKVTGKNPSKFNKANGPDASGDHPVEMVSWDDAVAFCQKLSELPEEKKAGRLYRLPTEAEWEYACRAGTRTAYSWGDDPKQLKDHGWFTENSGGSTHPAGKLLPNGWGLFDMHGNLYEWCQDVYDPNLYSKGPFQDPVGVGTGNIHPGRGGAIGRNALFCRSSYRSYGASTDRDELTGFRVVCEVQPPAEKKTDK
jgi:WD40 repeat protein/serine/threonine protein kinase